MQQGDPSGPNGFCVGAHEDFDWSNTELKRHGGMAAYDMDDGYLAGPPDVVFAVAAELRERLLTRCGVELNVQKCEAWSPTPDVVDSFLSAHPETPYSRGTVPRWAGGPGRGVVVSGVPVGDTYFVEYHVQSRVEPTKNNCFFTPRCLTPEPVRAIGVLCQHQG